MITSIALAATLWPAAVTQRCAPPNDILIVGIATNHQNDFLYCEWFSKTDENKFRVSYLRDSVTIAVKDLDFSNSLVIPNVRQLDARTGELREANMENNKLAMKYREATDKKMEQATISLDKIDVLDAGFNEFVRSHWEQLIAGEAIPVNFGSIAHQKTLPLVVSAKPLSKCKNTINNEKKSGQFCFTVEIDNMLLRLLIGNIKLSYDEQHRLEEFDGTVNIQDDKQKSQNAIIRYYYNVDHLPKNSQ